MLNRICTADYAVPQANYTIRKGTAVVISVMGFSRDPKYFPQPERFWPERFDAAEPMYNENAFMSFGMGPRQCIGKWCTKNANAYSSLVVAVHDLHNLRAI